MKALRFLFPKALKRLILGLLTVVGISVTLMIITLLVGLSTNSGQIYLAQLTSHLLSTKNQKIHIGQVNSLNFSGAEVTELVIKSNKKKDISADSISVSWNISFSPLPKLKIKDIKIGTLEINRLPKTENQVKKNQSATSTPTPYTIPILDSKITINHLKIPKIGGMTDYAVAFSIQTENHFSLSGTLDDLQNKTQLGSLSAELSKSDDKSTVRISFIDKDRSIMSLVNGHNPEQEAQPSSISVKGQGSATVLPLLYEISISNELKSAGTFMLKKSPNWKIFHESKTEITKHFNEELNHLTEGKITSKFEAEWHPTHLQLVSANIAMPALSLEGSGHFDFKNGTCDLKGHTYVKSLTSLGNLMLLPASGSGDISFTATGPFKDLPLHLNADLKDYHVIQGDLSMQRAQLKGVLKFINNKLLFIANADVNNLEVLHPSISQNIDSKLNVYCAGEASFSGTNVFFKDIEITGNNITARAQGSLKSKTSNLSISLNINEINNFTAEQLQLSTPLTVSAQLLGSVKNPELKGTLSLPKLTFEKQNYAASKLNYALSSIIPKPKSQLSVTGTLDNTPVKLSGELINTAKILNLKDINYQLGKDNPQNFTGHIGKNKESKRLVGELNYAGHLPRLLQEQAQLTGLIKANLKLTEKNTEQSFIFQGSVPEGRWFDKQIEGSSFSGSIENIFSDKNPMTIVSSVDFPSISLFGRTPSKLTFKIKGPSNRIAIESRLSHGPEDQVNQTMHALYSQQTDAAPQFTVSSLTGSLHSIPTRLAKPLTFELTKEKPVSQSMNLQVGKGMLTGTIIPDWDRFKAEFNLKDIPLMALGPFYAQDPLAGTLQGTVALSRDTSKEHALVGSAKLTGNNVFLDNPFHEEIEKADLRIDAELSKQALDATLKMGTKAKDLKLTLKLPLKKATATTIQKLYKKPRMNLSLEGDADLAIIRALTPLGEDNLSGRLSSNIALSGSYEKPKFTGTATVSDLSYESKDNGLTLSKVKFSVEGQSNTLKLGPLAIEGAKKGSLTAQGNVIFETLTSPKFSGQANLNKFKIIDQKNTSLTASGRFRLIQKKLEPLILKGKLEVNNARHTLSDTGQEAAQVQLIEKSKDLTINQPSALKKIADKTRNMDRKSFPLQLNVRVKVPTTLALEAEGLKTDLKGNLHIIGPVNAPIIQGALVPVHGSIDFLGAKLVIARGSFSFDTKAGELIPYVDLVAEKEVSTVEGQLRIMLQVSGPATKPEIKITSSPQLDINEILSRLLFQKGIHNISTLEAVRLAAIAGRGLNLGGISNIQSIFGLEDIELESSSSSVSSQTGDSQENDKSGFGTVRIGKRIGKKYKISVEQDFDAQTTKGTVEAELTPHFSVEAGYGTEGQATVGLKGQWEY